MSTTINKTMDRADLMSDEGQRFVRKLRALADDLDRRRLPVSSWHGRIGDLRPRWHPRRILGEIKADIKGTRRPSIEGEANRGGPHYEPLFADSNDKRHPWFLFWEAYWVLRNGPPIRPTLRLLDAGGTASLFSCYLASLGCRVDSIDLNPRLVEAGARIAKAMGWDLHSHAMDMTDMSFEDSTFDHAYSICVFEHLDASQRRLALEEIARVLKPGGTLNLTFDYRGKGVSLAGRGPNYDPVNLIQTPEDVVRHFLSTDHFTLEGNDTFVDDGSAYLAWPGDERPSYTFGALFLRRRD